jgi:predicted permease
LSLVLLIAATLLVRSFVSLKTTETGFDPRGVLTFEALATWDPATGPPTFFVELEERVAALPGVAAVGGTTALPFSRWAQSARVAVGGAAIEGEAPRIGHRLVTPGYFGAIGLPVRSGRAFDVTDVVGAPEVAIVNEAFVAAYLAGAAEPIGQVVTVERGRRVDRRAIVGVVANVKHSRLFEPARPIVYAPVRQDPAPFQRFAVRVDSGDPMTLVEPIRRTAAAIDARQPLQEFYPFETLIAQSIEEERFYTQVLGAFAASAVLLTLAGIYGVVSYATRQREREVGIRMALGAGAGRVQGLVLGQGLVPVAIGLGLGGVGAAASAGLLRSLLHSVPAHDPVSFGLATILFALVAAVACLVPARRAARLDPAQVLRGE